MSGRSNARRLRKSMTPEEVKLWVQLRHLNRQGYHFRRQVPLDGYVLDFAEFKHRLIIEVDGSQHGMPEGEFRDSKRDGHFQRSGFRVVRFWNVDINQGMDGVVDKIWSALKETPPPLRGTSPASGEEKG